MRHTADSDGPRDALFVTSRVAGGLQASIRGHVLDLAEPTADQRLAPTPGDLLVASIASDVAWSARRFLHAHRLPDDLRLSAVWRSVGDGPSVADLTVTVTVSELVESLSDALEDRLAGRAAAWSFVEPTRLRLCV